MFCASSPGTCTSEAIMGFAFGLRKTINFCARRVMGEILAVSGVDAKEEAVSGKRKERHHQRQCSWQGQDAETEVIGGSADPATRRGPNYDDMPSISGCSNGCYPTLVRNALLPSSSNPYVSPPVYCVHATQPSPSPAISLLPIYHKRPKRHPHRT